MKLNWKRQTRAATSPAGLQQASAGWLACLLTDWHMLTLVHFFVNNYGEKKKKNAHKKKTQNVNKYFTYKETTKSTQRQLSFGVDWPVGCLPHRLAGCLTRLTALPCPALRPITLPKPAFYSAYACVHETSAQSLSWYGLWARLSYGYNANYKFIQYTYVLMYIYT